MTTSPLISIIVPIYKVEPYLKRCLDSIVNQTYTNLEIILVDDGSPDNCPAICDEYAAKDKRIVVIHKENGGLSDARNAGLDICKGEYISFVDSDDWVDLSYIEVLISLQKKYTADITIAEHDLIAPKTFYKKETFQYKEEIFNNKEGLKQLFSSNNPTYTVAWGKLYKKDLLKDFLFPLNKYHEDEFTTYKLFYHSKVICYTNKKLYNYFLREGNITSTSHPLDLLQAYEESFIFFKNQGEFSFTPYLFQRLCWQALYAYSCHNHPSNKNQTDLSKKIKNYEKDLSKYKLFFPHNIFLSFFLKFPSIYTFYRKVSPFHIRKR